MEDHSDASSCSDATPVRAPPEDEDVECAAEKSKEEAIRNLCRNYMLVTDTLKKFCRLDVGIRLPTTQREESPATAAKKSIFSLARRKELLRGMDVTRSSK